MESYDVAVVGAGSAGCALAGRLATKTDLRIVVVEAGPDYGRRAGGHWPADLLDAHHAPESHDWDFEEQSRARVVGGCSTHNECAVVRALPGDYDRWAIPGWGDADLAPVAREAAGTLPSVVRRDDELASWQRAFLDAAIDAGIPRLADADAAPGATGVAPFVQNIANGIRWNAAFAFLDPVRSRVAVIGDFLADRLVLDGGRARTGNRASAIIGRGPDGGERELHAERFVLCAGVYGSPTILLRSGVGPRGDLAALGIPVYVDLPGVGANLHDHPGVGLEYEPSARALRAVTTDEAEGRFYEAQVVLKAAPDLHVVPYQSADEGGWSFGIIAFHLDPRSRGRVRLASRDPDTRPAIDLRFLTDPEGHDAGALVEGMRLIHDLTKRAPLRVAIRRGPRRFSADARLMRYVRENVSDYGHSVGTCRMDPSPGAGVVDARGRVHGLVNVFVADASIVPRIPRANTNLTCSVIGVRLADLLAGG